MKKIVSAGFLASAVVCGGVLASCSSSDENAPSVATDTPAVAEESSTATSAAETFSGKPPREFLQSMLRGATVCNQVDVPFLAALGGAQTGFNAQAEHEGLKGAYLLSDESVKRYGFDENRDGTVDPMSPEDSTMTVARLSCQTAGIIDESLSDANKNINGSPIDVLAISVLYGEDPFSIVASDYDNDPLVQRWHKLYDEYRVHGVT